MGYRLMVISRESGMGLPHSTTLARWRMRHGIAKLSVETITNGLGQSNVCVWLLKE
jgi:hypothetical protein